MAETDYSIACDATCDLPASFLAAAKVAFADAPAAGDSAAATDAFERTYRELARAGFSQVVSLHSCATFSPLVDAARAAAARCADAVEVAVIDSGSASVATGMLVDRAARYRYFDVAFHDAVAGLVYLAEKVRLLVVPSAQARLARRRKNRRGGLLARATASVRIRLTGDRSLYLLAGDELTQLARSADVSALAERLASALGSVAGREGELVYALAEGGDARILHALESALADAGAPARNLGTVRALGMSEDVLGVGSLAVALAPETAYERAVETLHGLGSPNGAKAPLDPAAANVSAAQQDSPQLVPTGDEPKPSR